MFNHKIIAKYSAILDKLIASDPSKPPSATSALRALLEKYPEPWLGKGHKPIVKAMLEILGNKAIINKEQRIFRLLTDYLCHNRDTGPTEAKRSSVKTKVSIDDDFFSLWLVFFRQYPFLLAQLEPDNQDFYALWLWNVYDQHLKFRYDRNSDIDFTSRLSFTHSLDYNKNKTKVTQALHLFKYASLHFSPEIADYLINIILKKYSNEPDALYHLLATETSAENRKKLLAAIEKYSQSRLGLLRQRSQLRPTFVVELRSAAAVLSPVQQQEIVSTYTRLWQTQRIDNHGRIIIVDIPRITHMIPHMHREILLASIDSFAQYFDPTLSANVDHYEEQIKLANALLEALVAYAHDPIPDIPRYLATFLITTLDSTYKPFRPTFMAKLAIPGFCWLARSSQAHEFFTVAIQKILPALPLDVAALSAKIARSSHNYWLQKAVTTALDDLPILVSQLHKTLQDKLIRELLTLFASSTVQTTWSFSPNSI